MLHWASAELETIHTGWREPGSKRLRGSFNIAWVGNPGRLQARGSGTFQGRRKGCAHDWVRYLENRDRNSGALVAVAGGPGYGS